MSQALEEMVIDALRRRGWKLVTAESCTGGRIGDKITNVPGSSDVYLGGVISYANEAKQHLLGVGAETLNEHGAVSAETVREMARGARALLKEQQDLDAVVGLSISGIAGPGGGTPGKPVGLIWVGLSGPLGEGTWSFLSTGDREVNKEYAARAALGRLLEYLNSAD